MENSSFKHDNFHRQPESKKRLAAKKQALDQMFRPILKFKESFLQYDESDLKIIQDHYPLVFGATEIKLIDYEELVPSEVGRVARRVPKSICTEYAYQGDLKIGDDLSFIFVPQKFLKVTKDYLAEKTIEKVKVCSFEALRLASKFAEFQQKKAEAKDYGEEPSLLRKRPAHLE